MSHLDRSVAKAQTRIMLGDLLQWLGVCLLAGLGVGSLVVLARHVFAWESTPWWVYASLGGVAVVAAVVIAASRRPGFAQAAVIMDDRLGLKDRIGTALYARTIKDTDPLAAIVISDAENAALAAKVDQVAPLKFGRVWHWLPPAAAVFAVLLAFPDRAEPWDPMNLLADAKQAEEEAQQAEAAEQRIVEAKALIEDIQADGTDADMKELDLEEAIKEIANITRKDVGNPEMHRQAVAKLASVQDKLNREIDAQEEEFNAIQAQLSQLDPGKGPAEKFANAMRRGDFQQAAKELEKLAEQIDNGQLSQQQKQQLQNQLNNMQQQLQNMANQAQQQQQQAQQQMQQQLQNAGFSQQQAQQMAQQFQNGQMSQQQMQQQIQQQMQQGGMSQQQAQQQSQQMAQNMQQQKQQAQQAGNRSQQMQNMSQSMGQMGQCMNPGGQQGQGQQGQQPSAQQSAFSAQQQLNQMAQMQQQMQQMGQAQQSLQQAMNQMNGQGQQGQGQGQQGQGMGRGQGNSQFGMGMNQGGQNNQPGQSSGNQPGGRQAGTGEGGNPYGTHRQHQGYQADYRGDIKEGEGRVIASWMTEGENAKGESNVAFDTTITAAADQAEKAAAADRVPRRYHETIRDYFRQLPESPDQVREAPAAPR